MWGVLATLYDRTVVVVFLGMVLTALASVAIAVLLGSLVDYWDVLPVFSALTWTLASGTSILFRLGDFQEKSGTSFRTIKQTLGPPTIIAAFVGFSVLPLPYEIGLLPVVTVVVLIDATARSRNEYAIVTRITSPLIISYAIFLIALAVRDVLSDIENLKVLSGSILLPLWMTICGVVYMMSLAALDRVSYRRKSRSKVIRKEDYGDRWPLTVESAKLCCRASAVWIEVGKNKYPLNGTAKTFLPKRGIECLELEDIWREDPAWESIRETLGGADEVAPMRVSISGLIRDGLSLEENA